SIDRGTGLVRGEAVQVEVGLPGEVPPPETSEKARIEPDDGPFHVLAGVADVEACPAVDELRERRQRLRLLADGRPGPLCRPGWVNPRTRPGERDDPFHGAREDARLVNGNALRGHRQRPRRAGDRAQPLPEVSERSVQSPRPATALLRGRRLRARASPAAGHARPLAHPCGGPKIPGASLAAGGARGRGSVIPRPARSR